MSLPLSTAASSRHCCAICNKVYSTNSHLRRHEATHHGRQELACPLCRAQFSRRDLAQRHVQKCSASKEVVLPILKGGRKRMSCDICSQRKLSCDTMVPCMRCRSVGIECTYERLGLPSSSATSRIGVNHSSYRNASNTQGSTGGDYGRHSIDFLLNFTSPLGYRPSAAIAAEATNVITVEHSAESWNSQFRTNDHYSVQSPPSRDSDDFPTVFLGFPPLMPGEEEGRDGSMPVIKDCSLSDLEEAFALEGRINELICQLSAHQDSMLEHGSIAEARFDVQLARFVFDKANVRQFIWEFFHYFHDQFPVLHKPTFDSQTVSLPLLLTVVLFGSMSSNPSDISIEIRQFFNVAESYVFDRVVSKHMLQRSCGAPATNEIELLQAGLLLLVVLNNSNDPTVRRRLRLQRIPCLVAAVRASGLFSYRRQHSITGEYKPNWQLFILDEVQLRVAVWTFIADSTLAMFFNGSPHVAISEMTGGLPCREDLFRAETAVEFEHAVSPCLLGHPDPTFPRLMSTLLSVPLLESPAQTVEHVTAANMLILICALQSNVMTFRMHYLAPPTAEALLSTLDRWKSLWDAVHETSVEGFDTHTGFERHAAAYWWLTRTLLKIVQSGDQSCRYLQPYPSDSVKDLHDFVRKYKNYVN
ncbi:hypothetical protein C7974DRAFT_393562 [Boeremia exigua]|uniref:uncharacterized protein n=1 Tax=Boeremia exigua TaxID=749465 RepID=UPI001E8EE9B3|nr:uncharacterized protein C7974DRAFT_393562 [Boeremia exigua]KAH6628969.1 hypothetical protein C7974DRAFT_393562 [Boeremia exigua]